MTHYARDECYNKFNKNDALIQQHDRPIDNNIYGYEDPQTHMYPYEDYGVSGNLDEYAVNTEGGVPQDGSYNQNFPLEYTDKYSTDRSAGNLASGDYWDDNEASLNEYSYGYGEYNTKMLPTIPTTHNNYSADSGQVLPMEGEGTYERRGSRYGVRLPAAPGTLENSNSVYRMLPEVVAYQNVHNAQHNFNGHDGYATHRGLIDERIGSFISLPATAPLRMLPKPRPRSSQQLFKGSDDTGNRNLYDSDANGEALRTSNISGTCTSGVSATTGTSYYDVYCHFGRPYTSMLPVDYNDSEYGSNLDNLSVYSDTPPVSNNQHKLQQHQRKISLMMAMTTASVIASGETRVPVQQNQQKRSTDIYSTLATSCPAATLPAASSPTVISSALTTSSASAFANATVTDSVMWSKSDVFTIPSTKTTTRKLPKRLPSPPYKSPPYTTELTDIHNTISQSTLTSASAEKNHRIKQLPKLPQPKANSVPISSADNVKDPIVSLTTISSRPSPEGVPDKVTNSGAFSPKASVAYITDVNNTARSEPKSIDSYKSWSTTSIDSTPLHINNKIQDELNFSTLEPESFLNPAVPTTSTHSPFTTGSTETAMNKSCASITASLDISDYLKPYTLDSISFSDDNQKIDPNHISYANSKVELLDSFKLSSLDTHKPYSMTNWTSSPIENETTKNGAQITVASSGNSPNEMSCLESRVFAESTESFSYHDAVVTTFALSHISNVFTTSTVPLGSSSPAETLSSSINESLVTTTLSYTEYMKKFELPELPPVFESYNNQINGMEDNTILEIIPKLSNDEVVSSTFAEIMPKLTTEDSITKPLDITTSTKLSEYKEFKLSDYNFTHTPNDTEDTPWLSYSTEIDTSQNSKIIPEITNFKDMELMDSSTIFSSTEKPLEHSSLEFDDHFYDSFNVDLSALTATIAHIECETSLATTSMPNNFVIPAMAEENTAIIVTEPSEMGSKAVYDTGLDLDTFSSSSLTQGGYYKPLQKPINVAPEYPPLTPPKGKVVALAATSMLGGLSKGIKGGLDGVLSGVASTMDATKQQQLTSNNTKKGFGFSLASKLVPNVESLLTSSNKHEDVPEILDTRVPTTSTYVYETDQIPIVTAESTTPTPSMECLGLSAAVHNNSSYGSRPNKFNTEFDNLECKDDEPNYSDDVMSIDNSRTEVILYDDEYGYSDYPALYQISGDGHTDNTNTFNGQNSFQPNIDSCEIQPKATSTPNKKDVPASSSGGVFSSIFGKAAAAVQSATQAVNQGASSVASAVAQKTTINTATGQPKSSDLSVMSAPNKMIPNVSDDASAYISNHGLKTAPDYGVIMDNDYNELMINQEALTSQYLTTGDDYENSNTHMLGYDINNDNKAYSIYYSDNNQSQLNDIELVESHTHMHGLVSDGQKLLPAVPSAGSTGKRLSTINGKSGLLIKQQPTEIFDDDESDVDVIDNDFIQTVDKQPNYCINSEQQDYYMDQQQTTPSSRGANDYYTHIGINYRDDYFNEEDEYKYLEQQKQQKQQQQTEQKIKLNQKQTSLDYIDDQQDDDFLNEHYRSDEDCGNYLDESSSSSVGIGEARKMQTDDSTLTTVASNYSIEHTLLKPRSMPGVGVSLAGGHQLIKKQDSIIIEEGESILDDNLDDDFERIAEPDIDEDHLTELVLPKAKSVKKKILMRGETEEVESGHMQILRKPGITAKQRWHWAYNKIIIQLNVSHFLF